jgi:hypothetical protein
VDVVLGSYLGWFKVFEKMVGVRVLDAARTPLLAAWGERFAAKEAAKDVLPDDVDKGCVHFPCQPKIFSLSLVTSNLSTHVWSIKCR